MKFNQPNTNINKTTNLAGGEAYKESPKLELVSMLLTSFVQDQFYKSASDGLNDLKKLVDQIPDKKFIAKAGIYARNVFGMRSITHVLAGEIASKVKGEVWTKDFFNQIIHRPDDMLEIMAYYQANYGKNEPNALKKGFATALTRFNEYQLAKYKKAAAAYSLIDIANMVHPQHTPTIEKLIKGTLPNPDTWEVLLTQAGSDQEKKKQAWMNLVVEKKLGYFALLRNLRNILENAPDVVESALEQLIDKEAIKKSLVMPFRFSTALEEIEKLSGVDTKLVRKTIIAINKAVDISCSNVPSFDGNTLVVLDGSGSMEGKPFNIGSLSYAVLIKANNADYITFADTAEYKNFNPTDSTLTLKKEINRTRINGGTNFHSIFEEASKAYDRIIILSDMQGWIGHYAPTSTFNKYKTRTGCNPFIYSFDLAGHGTLQFPENQVFCLAGFSEQVFEVLKLLEQDRHALINEIEKVEL